jgi:hypothetical protein
MNETAGLTVTLVSTGAPLATTACRVRLDEGATPYATASVTIGMPTLAQLAALDPQDRPTIRIQADRRRVNGTFTGVVNSALDITLRVVDRSIDARAATVTLTLANDESFLDYAPTEDLDFQDASYSVRIIIGRVLQRALALAAAPAVFTRPDSRYKTARTLRNLIPESSFEYPFSQWKGVNATLTRSGLNAKSGGNSLRIAPTTQGRFDSYAETDVSLTPGKTYRLSAWATSDYGIGGGVDPIYSRRIGVFTTVNGVTTPVGTSYNAGPAFRGEATSEVVAVFTVPEGTRSTTVRLYNGRDTQVAGAYHYDAVMLIEAPFSEDGKQVAYFDGSTPDDDLYVYAWDGDRELSTSTRRARIDRPGETLIWRQGQTARDYLAPILQAAGLRLFQQVNGDWTAVDNSYIALFPRRLDHLLNLYQITETGGFNSTHPDGSPLWADAVAVTYNWLDGNGERATRVDIDAAPNYRKLYQVTLDDTVYPGPGAAAYIRSRLAMRSRQVTVTGRVDLSVVPSQELTVSAQHTGLQTGLVDSVEFDFDADEMTIVGKRMTATPTTAWNQLSNGVRWSDSPVGASWASETA